MWGKGRRLQSSPRSGATMGCRKVAGTAVFSGGESCAVVTGVRWQPLQHRERVGEVRYH
jgi:hypothetical protein